jgi:hypothetical protein
MTATATPSCTCWCTTSCRRCMTTSWTCGSTSEASEVQRRSETTRAWHPCPPQAQAHAHGQTVTWYHLLLLCCHAPSCAVMRCHVLSRVLTLHGRGLDTRTHTAAVSTPAATQHHHHHHVMRQLCSPQFVTALVCLSVCRRVLQPHLLLLPSLPPLQGPAPVFECAEQ